MNKYKLSKNLVDNSEKQKFLGNDEKIAEYEHEETKIYDSLCDDE
jgi:hypothetical protein